MAHGRKTGGRRRGTPNKLTQSVIDRLHELGCDPIEGMAKIAADEATPVELRARMFAELAQYVAPKRKAIDHRVEQESDAAMRPRVIRIIGVDPDPNRFPERLPPHWPPPALGQ